MKSPGCPKFSLSTRDLQLRYLALSGSVAPLLGAYIYNQGYQIPFACPIRHLTGIPCPTCGMTRSLMAAVRGEWMVSIDYHLFGPILIAVLIGIAIHLVLELVLQRQIPVFHHLPLRKGRLALSLLWMLLGYHLTRLIFMYQIGVLTPDFLNSPLGRLIYG
jgi:hypothetical protein